MDNKPLNVYATEFGALIRTRCPKHHITDKMIHDRAEYHNLSAGDVIRVQCFNPKQTGDIQNGTVFYFCEYLVYDKNVKIKRMNVNDRDIRQSEVMELSVMQLSEWKKTPAATDGEIKIVWNPGKKKHEVQKNDEVLYEDSDKSKAEEFAASYAE